MPTNATGRKRGRADPTIDTDDDAPAGIGKNKPAGLHLPFRTKKILSADCTKDTKIVPTQKITKESTPAVRPSKQRKLTVDSSKKLRGSSVGAKSSRPPRAPTILPPETFGNTKSWDEVRVWLRNRRDAVQQAVAPICLITGPPGIGKTTGVRRTCALFGVTLKEVNGSDLRTASTLMPFVEDVAFAPKTLLGATALLIDEIDGLYEAAKANGSKGVTSFVTALTRALRDRMSTGDTIGPIFAIANDNGANPVKSLIRATWGDDGEQRLAKHVRMYRLYERDMRQILRARLPFRLSQAHQTQLITQANGDGRALLNGLRFLGVNDRSQPTSCSSNRDASVEIFNSAEYILYGHHQSSQVRFCWGDYHFERDPFMSIAMLHENYPKAAEMRVSNQRCAMELIASTSDLLSCSDIFASCDAAAGGDGSTSNPATGVAICGASVLYSKMGGPTSDSLMRTRNKLQFPTRFMASVTKSSPKSTEKVRIGRTLIQWEPMVSTLIDLVSHVRDGGGRKNVGNDVVRSARTLMERLGLLCRATSTTGKISWVLDEVAVTDWMRGHPRLNCMKKNTRTAVLRRLTGPP